MLKHISNFSSKFFSYRRRPWVKAHLWDTLRYVSDCSHVLRSMKSEWRVRTPAGRGYLVGSLPQVIRHMAWWQGCNIWTWSSTLARCPKSLPQQAPWAPWEDFDTPPNFPLWKGGVCSPYFCFFGKRWEKAPVGPVPFFWLKTWSPFWTWRMDANGTMASI